MTGEDRLPGDLAPEALIERMIRVDHAGEFGAARIYQGQLAVLGRSKSAATIRRMAEQEQRHLAAFDALVVERRVRPTALSPLWHAAGFALGAASAALGERAAMACTVAVEEVYRRALRRPGRQTWRRRGRAARPDRGIPRRRNGAPRHRSRRGRRTDDRLPALLGRDQGRHPPRHLALGAGLGPDPIRLGRNLPGRANLIGTRGGPPTVRPALIP